MTYRVAEWRGKELSERECERCNVRERERERRERQDRREREEREGERDSESQRRV